MIDHREENNRNPSAEEERPPFFSTWRGLYAAVLGSLIFYVFLMLVFMKVFA